MSQPTSWGCANSASRVCDIPKRPESNWPKSGGMKDPP
jgi:hypothetical protein